MTQHQVVWTLNNTPSTLLPWASSVEKSRAGGDIILEVLPSKKRFNVSRLHINRLPYLDKLLNWLEKRTQPPGSPNQLPLRLERVSSGELKTIFTISEDHVDLFEILIRILHFTTDLELWNELERLTRTGELLPLLEFATRYHHSELTQAFRLKLAAVILGATTPLDTVLQILSGFDQNIKIDTIDGDWHTKSEEQLMAHPVARAAFHRLRCESALTLQSNPLISSIPSLLLMRLIVFGGEDVAMHASAPSWKVITKKRIFADAAIMRDRALLRARHDISVPPRVSEVSRENIHWDIILATLVKESYGDSERLAKRLVSIWQRRSPDALSCSPTVQSLRDTLKRAHSDESGIIQKQRQRYRDMAQKNPTEGDLDDTSADRMDIDSGETSQQGVRSRALSAPQVTPEVHRSDIIHCETILMFSESIGSAVFRTFSSSVVTTLKSPCQEKETAFLDFFIQAERMNNVEAVEWEYKLCVRWKPTVMSYGVAKPPVVRLLINTSIWASSGDVITLPDISETYVHDRALSFEPIILQKLGESRGNTPARSIPILIEGITLPRN